MSDSALFISEILKGMSQGFMKGMEMRAAYAKDKAELDLKKQELDVKKKALLDETALKQADLAIKIADLQSKDFDRRLQTEIDQKEFELKEKYKGLDFELQKEREGRASEKDKFQREIDILKLQLDGYKAKRDEKFKQDELDLKQRQLDETIRNNNLKDQQERNKLRNKGAAGVGDRTIVGFGSEVINDKRSRQKVEDTYLKSISSARTIDQIDELSGKFRFGDKSKTWEIMKKRLMPAAFDEDKRNIGALISRVKADIRVEVTGGGNISAPEQKLLNSIATNPSNFFQDVDASMAALRALKGQIAMAAAEKGMANGIVFPRGYFKNQNIKMNTPAWKAYESAHAAQIVSDEKFAQMFPGSAYNRNAMAGGTKPAGEKQNTGEITRITKDGKTAVFDAKTKKFLRWK